MKNIGEQLNHEASLEEEKPSLTVEFGVEYSSILKNRYSDSHPAWYYTIPFPTLEKEDYFVASNITPEERGKQMPYESQELPTWGLEEDTMEEAKAGGVFMDASEIPLSDKSVDNLIHPNLFGDPAIPHDKKNLFSKEAERVLNEGGQAIIIEDAPQDASPKELIKFFSKSGLKLKDIFFETGPEYQKGTAPPYWAIFKKEAEDNKEIGPELSEEVIKGLNLEGIYQEFRDAGMTPAEIQKSFGGYRRLLQINMHEAVVGAILKNREMGNTRNEEKEFLSRIDKALSFGVQEDDITREHLEELKSMAEQINWRPIILEDIEETRVGLKGLIEKYIDICRELEGGDSDKESTIKRLKNSGFYDYEMFRRRTIEDFLED